MKMKNHSEILPYIHYDECGKKRKIARDGKAVEKLEPECTVGRNAKWYSPHGKENKIPQKIKNRITYDSEIPLQCIYPK